MSASPIIILPFAVNEPDTLSEPDIPTVPLSPIVGLILSITILLIVTGPVIVRELLIYWLPVSSWDIADSISDWYCAAVGCLPAEKKPFIEFLSRIAMFYFLCIKPYNKGSICFITHTYRLT